jgi:AraC family transcriptional regulator, transcriptional activator of pobA
MQLLTISQAIKTYHHLHEEKPKFGMNVIANDFKPDQIVIAQNDGQKKEGIPVRFDFYIMILCLTGGSFRNVNQYEYIIEEHSLQLIPPGTIHSFKDRYEDSRYYVVLFEKDFFSKNDILDFHNNYFNSVNLNLKMFDKVKKLYEEIEIELKSKKEDNLEYSRNLLNQILIILKREKLEDKIDTNKSRADLICNQFLSLIEIHFNKMKSVQEYAELIELTPKHLSETVKEKLGESALFFIHERIIKEAKYLLVYSNKTIYNIAIDLSFYDASQFTRFFKQKIGISPNHYRNKNKS